MLQTKSLISALALSVLAFPALAQDTASTQTATAETQTTQDQTGASAGTTAVAATPAAAPTADAGLDTGTPEGTKEGQAYVREKAGDWEIQCARTNGATPEPCQMYQLLLGASGNPVAEFLVERLPEGGKAVAGATVIVPHGTALAKDLTISIDGSRAKVYRYAFCDPGACYARLGLLADDLAAYKNGANATLTIYPYERLDDKIKLTLSLSGFTAGFDLATVVPR